MMDILNFKRTFFCHVIRTRGNYWRYFVFCVFVILVFILPLTQSHGRLWEPPSRATMWRMGFHNPQDYNDNEGNCGGFATQWSRNRGKCGICGDAWDAKIRSHEAPRGKYANGIITRTYKEGQVIPTVVQLTASHRGYFQFRLCPNNNAKQDPIQECFDKYLLQLADGSGTKYYVPSGSRQGMFNATVILPERMACSQCILQWEYVAANSWGICPNGTGRLGCGNQETFKACSDVAIIASSQNIHDDRVVPPILSPTIQSTTIKPYYPTPKQPHYHTPIQPYYSTTPRPTNRTRRPYHSSTTRKPIEYSTRKAYYEISRRPHRPTTITQRPYAITRIPTVTQIPYNHLDSQNTDFQANNYHHHIVSTPKPPKLFATTFRQRLPPSGPIGGRYCVAYEGVGVWKRLPGIQQWCYNNCNNPGAPFCPSDHCRCIA